MTRPLEARHKDAQTIGPGLGIGLFDLCLQSQAYAVSAVEPAIPVLERAAGLAAAALRGDGRLVYCGSGSSGLMALSDALELAGTFGLPPARTPILFPGGAAALVHMTGGPEDDPALAESDLAALSPSGRDVFLCVSASGSTPYTVGVAQRAKAAGAAVIGIANVPDGPLLRLADCPVFLDSGAEVITGSTRLGAATAQKVALNLFSVRLGVLLGHVHAGHMVNLVADNAKLVARSRRIVQDIADCDETVAGRALEAAAGRVKVAVLVALGATPDQAQGLLDLSGGHLHEPIRKIRSEFTDNRAQAHQHGRER